MVDFFFFNDTATTEIYTLSLHDALPISAMGRAGSGWQVGGWEYLLPGNFALFAKRSEEHTSELQSQSNLVCRLLLEKKKERIIVIILLLHFLSCMLGSVLVLMHPSLACL